MAISPLQQFRNMQLIYPRKVEVTAEFQYKKLAAMYAHSGSVTKCCTPPS